ncbi:TPA: hypothetical protein N0F65_009443 [Lagenidium giganteum]|uniref:Uncharacterized protein n=1 Tax=Lagenidium giganteum TaxID=4803 RepID=A0AAV2ZCQ0_9STRA|nr:TPA: hypothetical protein N0F65_009443 [Lagenidium giganteum]
MFPSDDSSRLAKSKAAMLDDNEGWFEQDKVPLVTARYDNDDVGEACLVKKAVVMRSPRATAAASASASVAPTDSHKARTSAAKDDGVLVRMDSSGSGGDGDGDFEDEGIPQPPSDLKSPKSPKSASGSPRKKSRYGRKNYRANSSRKKNV